MSDSGEIVENCIDIIKAYKNVTGEIHPFMTYSGGFP